MSSKDDRGRGGAPDDPPMLILGDDLPDLEDTTLEELRRQQEEARREQEQARREQEQARREIEAARRSAEEEIERRRREAEREIAELEAQKEGELREREVELERTQRKLYKRETRLLRKAKAAGASTGTSRRLVDPPPPRTPLRQRGLARSVPAGALGLLAALCLGAAALTAATGDSELAAELERTDQARVLWLQSGLETDEAIALRMAGLPLPPEAGGAGLADEAVELDPGSRYYLESTQERTDEMLAQDTSTVRALTLWTQERQDASYAASPWELDELREQAVSGSSVPTLLATLGLGALLVLLVLALLARARLAVALLAVGAGLAVATIVTVAPGMAALPRAAADHEAADDVLDDLYDQVGDDLQAAYGTSTSPASDRPDYWTDDPFYREHPAGVDGYLQVRETVGRAVEDGDAAAAVAAVSLVEAGQATFEAHVPALEEARDRLVAGLDPGASLRARAAGLGLAAAALVVAGVLVSRGRKETA